MRWNIQQVTAVNFVANARTCKTESTCSGKPSSVPMPPLPLPRVAPALSTGAGDSDPARNLRLAARYPSSGFEAPLLSLTRFRPDLLNLLTTFVLLECFEVTLYALQILVTHLVAQGRQVHSVA